MPDERKPTLETKILDAILADADVDVRAAVLALGGEAQVRQMLTMRLREVVGPTVEELVRQAMDTGASSEEEVIASTGDRLPTLGPADVDEVLRRVVEDVLVWLREADRA